MKFKCIYCGGELEKDLEKYGVKNCKCGQKYRFIRMTNWITKEDKREKVIGNYYWQVTQLNRRMNYGNKN